MAEGRRIVGVWLLRNEEYFAGWSLMNAVGFCDRVLVLDNGSRDRTRDIVEAVAARHRHIEILDVEDTHDTHKYLEDYAGTPTWVIGVDGDEIYDPIGLAYLRERLLSGEFDRYWRIAGHMRHVLGIRFDRAEAFGYTQPEAPEVTKCFNFGAIESWRPGPYERLHGLKSVVYRPGYGRDSVSNIWRQDEWSHARFRCLHLCFMPRSPLDERGQEEIIGRATPRERRRAARTWHRLRHAVGRSLNPHYDVKRNYKRRTYAKGPVATFDISGFGAPDDCCAVDPGYAGALKAIRSTTERRAAMQPRSP